MRVITGAFDSVHDAESAVHALQAAGFTLRQDLSEAMSAPELEASLIHSSPGAEEAGPGAARGAAAGVAVGAILGLGAVPFAGALGVLSGVGVGAYAGSLLGALRGIGDEAPDSRYDGREPRRNGGPHEGEEGAGPRFVVLKTLRPEGRDRAVHILNEHGAVRVSEVERDEDG